MKQQMPYTVLTDEFITLFIEKIDSNFTKLLKEYIEIHTNKHTIKETTLAIDNALKCICDWNEIIELSWQLSKYTAKINWTYYIERKLLDCRQNMFCARALYEELKESGYYYDAQFCALSRSIISEKAPKDYFRVNSKHGRHGPYKYCIEAELLTKSDYYDLFRPVHHCAYTHYNRFIYRDINKSPKVASCFYLDFKYSTSLKEVKEMFPIAIVHHGTDGFQFYKKYIALGIGPEYIPMILPIEWKIDEGESYYFKNYSQIIY